MTPDSSNDHATTVAELRQLVREFVSERDWDQFHNPKNLSMSLAIEAAELMEHFQWLTNQEAKDMLMSPIAVADVGEELADIICYALALANVLNLDLSQTVLAKMQKNRLKYPAEKYQGKFK